MSSTLAIPDALTSLAEVNTKFGLSQSLDAEFFTEWLTDIPEITAAEQQRLDQLKYRYLYHRQYGHLLENAVNFLVISPVLELAGFYDPPFRLRSEVAVRLEIEDEDGTVYQGRIDALIVSENLWVIMVEAKRTSFNMTLALPQALAYMTASPSSRPVFGLVSNGEYSMFIKLADQQYGFSDDFSLNRRRNELHDVLRILNHFKNLPSTLGHK